jgi:hypothetical protein
MLAMRLDVVADRADGQPECWSRQKAVNVLPGDVKFEGLAFSELIGHGVSTVPDNVLLSFHRGRNNSPTTLNTTSGMPNHCRCPVCDIENHGVPSCLLHSSLRVQILA